MSDGLESFVKDAAEQLGKEIAENKISAEFANGREFLDNQEILRSMNFENLNEPQKLDVFKDLETKMAKIEDRLPRAVSLTENTMADVSATNEEILFNKKSFAELTTVDEETKSTLEREIFSAKEKGASAGNVSFRGNASCDGCVGSCRGDCSGSNMCYYTK